MDAYCPIVLLSYCHNWKIGSLQPPASLSQAYPIMSATMRSSSAAARQKCLKVNTSV